MRVARSLGRGALQARAVPPRAVPLCAPRARAVPWARALAVAQPWALPWAWALLWAWELARQLSWAQPWPRALPWALPWVPWARALPWALPCGRRLGLCGKSHPLGTEGGVRFIRRLRGQVVDHFFLFARSSIIFLLFGRGSSGGLGLFLLPGGLPLGLGAGCACFIGFLIENIFLKDLPGIRRDPKTARRTTTSPAVGRLGLRGLSAGSAGVSG